MKTLKSFIYEFYRNHKDFLLQNYPGLTERRLLQEITSNYLCGPYSFEELEDIVYFSHSTHQVDTFLKKVLQGIPLEYIVSRAYFYKTSFFVNNNVLIPRKETELLVEKAVEVIKGMKSKPVRVIDVGTGSGCIILSILKECAGHIEAYATDISEKALQLAQHNFYHLKFQIRPESTLEFWKGDQLAGFNGNGKFDIIVSNPPYIKKSAQSKVHPQVHSFEPHDALYLGVNDERYETWFEEFFKQMREHLREGGCFLMEGHEDELENLKACALDSGFCRVNIIKDYGSQDRILIGVAGKS